MVVYTFNEQGDSVIAEHKYFKNDFGRLRDVCVSPDGKVYIATNGNSWSNNNPFSHSIVELSNEAFVSTSSVDFEKAKFEVAVFPNPISQDQTLSIKIEHTEQCNFELYNTAGQLIMNKQVTDDAKLNLGVEAGIYYYRFAGANGIMGAGTLVVE